MKYIFDWLHHSTGSFLQWVGPLDSNLLYWPAVLAAGAVVVLCFVASVSLIDAHRRTSGTPTWVRLRHELAELTARRAAERRLLDSFAAERSTLQRELDELRAEKTRLVGIEKQRKEQETLLRDINIRLTRMADDRAKVDALRQELEQLRAEQTKRQQEIVRQKDEQAERQTIVDSLVLRQVTLEREQQQIKADRDATMIEVNSSKLELESIERQLRQANRAVLEATEKAHDETLKTEQLRDERQTLRGQVATLEGQHKQASTVYGELETKIAAAHATRTKLLEETARLEVQRGSLWLEVVSLQEKRNALLGEITDGNAQLSDVARRRDAAHAELEMLRRVETRLNGELSGRRTARHSVRQGRVEFGETP